MLLIIIGIVLLIPLAILALGALFHFIYWLLATNAIDYLIYPMIIASGLAGVWLLLLGLGVL